MPKPPRRRRSYLLPLLAVFVALIVFTTGVVLGTSPLDPVSWEPPPPMAREGPLASNGALREATLLAVPGTGPEDVAVLADGSVVAGIADGSLVRSVDGGPFEEWVNVGGRPLGMDLAPTGELVVAVANRGLVTVTLDGEVSTLVGRIGNRDLLFPDDVAIAEDGTIYFSVASWKFRYDEWPLDVMEGRANGALYRLEPDGEPEAIALNLYFANGVEVAPDESAVFVVETSRYRVRRVWLSGPRAPGSDVWVNALPGFPDGISYAGDGGYWVTIAAPRHPALDATANLAPLRHVLAVLPERIKPAPQPLSLVLRVDSTGAVDASLDDADTRLSAITNAEPAGDFLYLGALEGTHIGRMPLGAGAPTAEEEASEGSGAGAEDPSGSGESPAGTGGSGEAAPDDA